MQSLHLKMSVFFLLSTYTVLACSEQPNGFDEICSIYTEAQNSRMSVEDTYNYIFENIKNRVSFREALSVYDAGLAIDPGKRYPVFKESAEYVLKHEWNCPAMKAFLKESNFCC